MEKSKASNASEKATYSTDPRSKWEIDFLHKNIDNKDRLERVIRVLDSYDFDTAHSLSQGMHYGGKAAEIDSYVRFLGKPEVHAFLNSAMHNAGWMARDMVKIYRLPDGQGLLDAAMRSVVLVGKKGKEDQGYLQQQVMGMMAEIAKRTGDESLISASGAMLSKYNSEVCRYVTSEIEKLALKANTTKEAMATFIRIFDSEAVTSYINKVGEFGFSHKIVRELAVRARSRLRSKDQEKAYQRTIAYSVELYERLWNDDIVGVMRKQGEKGHPWTIYDTYGRLSDGKVSNDSLHELTLALAKREPSDALSMLRAVSSIWKELTRKSSLPESEFIRIIRLLEKTENPEDGYNQERMLMRILRDGLDRLVTNQRSFAIVSMYIESEPMLPKPTADNMGKYEELVNSYLKNRYGLEKQMSMEHVRVLFSLKHYNGGEEAMRQGAVYFINKSREENVRHYSISVGGSSVPVDYPKETLTRYAVLAVINPPGKDAESEAVISMIAGEKNINKARNNFNTSHKKLMPQILKSISVSNFDAAAELLCSTNDEAINDVVRSANYREISIGNAKFVRASEDKNPLSYDSGLQIACVYMPQGFHIFEYCADEKVTLVKYEVGGKTLGSAICYLEDNIFLVDSVEGHRTFRKPEIFEVVYNDLIQRALAKGATRILFSTDSNNETPGEFEDYLKSKGFRASETKMRLATNTYLEAGEDGVPAGSPQKVTGYLQQLPTDAQKPEIANTLRREQ